MATTKIRLAVAVDGDGRWDSRGCYTETSDDELREGLLDGLIAPVALYFIEAVLPIPAAGGVVHARASRSHGMGRGQARLVNGPGAVPLVRRFLEDAPGGQRFTMKEIAAQDGTVNRTSISTVLIRLSRAGEIALVSKGSGKAASVYEKPTPGAGAKEE